MAAELALQLADSLHALVTDYHLRKFLPLADEFTVSGATGLKPEDVMASDLLPLTRNHLITGLRLDAGNMFVSAHVVLRGSNPEAELVVQGNHYHHGLRLMFSNSPNAPHASLYPSESAANELSDLYSNRDQVKKIKDGIALVAMARKTIGLE